MNDAASRAAGLIPPGSPVCAFEFRSSPPGQRGRPLVLAIILCLLLTATGHAATATWDGGGANDNWTTATNWAGDVAPVTGDDLVFPLGAARLSNTNDFPAGTIFNSITLSGNAYSLYGSAITINAGINATNTTVPNYVYAPLTLRSNQTITTGNAGVNLFLYGAIDTDGKELTFAGHGGAQVGSFISGAGGLIKTGSGGLLLYASNTFSGPVQLDQGTLNIYDDHALGATNGSTTISPGAILTMSAALTGPIAEPFVLGGSLAAASLTKTLSGPVVLSSSNAALAGPMVFNGIISGSGGFTKTSSDALTLNANNTYSGTTTIDQGVLLVNGAQPDSPIVLSGAAVGGWLGGTGLVGTLTASGALGKTIAPGNGGPGILGTSNVLLNSSTTFVVKLNGATAGSGYSQLNVNGSVSLNDAALSVALGFTPAIRDSFIIVSNDGSEAVSGTFSGLPEGAVLNLAGLPFRISYAGGTGNDIVLTRISPPAAFTSIMNLAGGQVQLQATGGLSGFAYTIQAATNLNPLVQWSNIGSAVPDSGGAITFTDANASLFPTRFYRALSP